MNDHEKVQVDENIRPYLDEIAEKLWSTPSHAAIMVGAGFSKNANKDFPDWTTLGDVFFEKIHRRRPDRDRQEDRYLDALRLAGEVEAAFGRPELDNLLRSHIPDNSSQFSDLHVKLLELPWSDIFTTNYDTLLEKACKSVTSQKFDIVVSEEDLVYSEKPRIIKLHGSLPSSRPFIITEEDYRKYPKEFAPFVNTVQQSMLENLFCLIGFSGNDPNFLQWIGWIRDNLGKENSPKIYLIGIFNLSDAQKKLLVDRNIVLVDLGKCPDIEDDHRKALNHFFDYLFHRKEKYRYLDWPRGGEIYRPDYSKEKRSQTEEILKRWRQIRESYPGWIVAPEGERESILSSTREWINWVDNIPSNDLVSRRSIPLDLEFLFEINWRLECCLCFIGDKLSKSFENVISRYWPFKRYESQESLIFLEDDENRDLNWKEIRRMWLHLSLSIMRSYREKGMLGKWEKTKIKLDNVLAYMSGDQKAFLYYETVLYELFELDIAKARLALESWPKDFSLPYWEAKRAGLLAETGQTREAEEILEKSLQQIRLELNLRSISTDYSLVSQEANLMVMLRFVKVVNFSANPTKAFPRNEMKAFEERHHVLMQHKCDPWNELKAFEYKLKGKLPATEEYPFDIGRCVKKLPFPDETHFNEIINAYSFLRYTEESGFLFKAKASKRISSYTLAGHIAKSTVQQISKYSLNWAETTLIRVSEDPEDVDNLFNRQFLWKCNVEIVDRLVDKYVKCLKKLSSDTSSADKLSIGFGFIVPEILSRLCCKCSMTGKEKLLDLVCEIYSTKHKSNYRGIKNFLYRLLDTCSTIEKYNLIPRLLAIPFPEDITIDEDEFVNPFYCLDLDKYPMSGSDRLNINRQDIESLLKLAGSDDITKRRWGIYSLGRIYNFDLLSIDQRKELGEILWSQTNNYHLPSNLDYDYGILSSLLNLPHPEKIDPQALIKTYILANISTNVDLYGEIIAANRDIHWSRTEIVQILTHLIRWWDMEKDYIHRLMETGFPVPVDRTSNLTQLPAIVLITVVFPSVQESIGDEEKARIDHLIGRLSQHQLPHLSIKAAGLNILNIDENLLLSEVKIAIHSHERMEVEDATDAILSLMEKSDQLKHISTSKLMSLLVQMMRSKHYIHVLTSLLAFKQLIKKDPQCLNFDSELLESLCNILQSMTEETNLREEDTISDFRKKIDIRVEAAAFAYQLYASYKRRGESVPDEITRWKKICSSDKEFAEIRAQWEPDSIGIR